MEKALKQNDECQSGERSAACALNAIQLRQSQKQASTDTFETIKATFETESATKSRDVSAENRTDVESLWYTGETCCMCSLQIPHLGTLLYAAADYDHNF